MKTLPFTLPLGLLLAACDTPETGIDHTVLSGTVTIPPASVEEKDPPTAPNDAAPQALGEDGSSSLTYRAVLLSGETSSFVPDTGGPGTEDDEVYGDADLYAFTPVADGTFTATMTFDPGTGTAGGDAVIYDVYIAEAGSLDVAGGLGTASSSGNGGVVTVSADVVAGTEYVLVIGGFSAEGDDAVVPYDVVLSGSAPGENDVLVGAYLEGDPAVGSAPVGGGTATDWVYDEATYTWTGSYELLYMRTVVMEDTDTADTTPADAIVDEALDGPLYLMAGTLSSLNATPSAGSLYSTTAVEATVTNEATTVDTAIVLDGLFPKVIGIQSVETTPDTTVAEINEADYTLNLDTLVAQDLGMLSGLGYVDTVDGASTISGSGWSANDGDAYAFTVPEQMYVRMTGSWGNAADDIDFGIWGNYDPYGTIDYFSSFGDSYCLTGANPEYCELIVPLEPDITYYLVALGYSGDAGDEPYHVELEWVAP